MRWVAMYKVKAWLYLMMKKGLEKMFFWRYLAH